MDNDLQHFGQRVREQRLAQGKKQEELADKVGISRTYLSQIEQGRARNLSLRVTQTLCKELGLEPPQESPSKPNPSLQQFAGQENLPEKDVQMLAGIVYRGKQPESVEQWRLLYNLIKTTLGNY